MAKKPKAIAKTKRVKVTATGLCEGFDINISAEFFPKGLASHEIIDVKRRLRQGLADTVSKLPFAFVFSNEVKVR